MTSFLFGGGAKTSASTPTPSPAALRIQSSVAGQPRPIGWGQARLSGNLLWYDDFTATLTSTDSPTGNGGKKGVKTGSKKGSTAQQTGQSFYVYSAAVIFGISEGQGEIVSIWDGKTQATLESHGLTQFPGSYDQATWSYLTTKHPAKALNYRGMIYVAAGPLHMGGSPELPNLNYEVKWAGSADHAVPYAINTAIPGIPDADPAAVVYDLMTNPHYGTGFPLARMGDLSTYSAYCVASSLVVSPTLTAQQPANGFLSDLMLATNSEFVWTGGKLTVVPYGDASITANGATYTAPSAPVYSLSDDDFLPGQGVSASSASSTSSADPVVVTRARPADQKNCLRVEYLDRYNAYNPTVAEAKDDAAIEAFGLKTSSTKQAHFFCLSAAAKQSVELQLGRNAVRNTYSFTLHGCFILVDPMDIIDISDAALGLDRQWVRVREIIENSDYSLSVVAEEYLAGTGSAPIYGHQSGIGPKPNYNASPGFAAPPVIVTAPVQLAQSESGLELWLATAGPGQYWGGCQVWTSLDGETYTWAGLISGPADFGALSADLAVGEDLDTANTLAVDLSLSGGALSTYSQADADSLIPLVWADGEWMAYQTATLTGTGQYDITYMQRGLFNSTISAHAADTSFLRIANNICKVPFTADQIGTTVYVKLVSFNAWGGGDQGLADVTVFSHTIQAPPPPPTVTNFTARQVGPNVSFTWTDVVGANAIKGYDIFYGPQGGGLANTIMLTEASRGTEMTNASVPPGPMTFYIRARDVANQLGPASSVDLLVKNYSTVLNSAANGPGWVGTLSGLQVHWTGILVPDSAKLACQMTIAELFEQFVPYPVDSASYTSDTDDIGQSSSVRAWIASNIVPGRGVVGSMQADQQLAVWDAGGTAVFAPWTCNQVQGQFFAGMLTLPASPRYYVTQFDVTVDIPQSTQTMTGVQVAEGGTQITFPTPFHAAPVVHTNPADSTLTSASAVQITNVGCIILGWSGTTAAAGPVNVTAIGA